MTIPEICMGLDQDLGEGGKPAGASAGGPSPQQIARMEAIRTMTAEERLEMARAAAE